jgi:putative transposase
MARVPRRLTVLPGHTVHKVWRGHNREWNLGTNTQKEVYLQFMNEDFESDKYPIGSFLNALTLMSNHTHEVSAIEQPKLYSNHMRRHHARYGQYFNRMNDRCGKVAQDRPHTTLLEGDSSEMEVVFYVHANPLRAKIVKDLRNYPWSTHNLYAFGKRKAWMRNIKLPKWYLALGKTPLLRQKTYRRLFAKYLKEKGLVKQSFLKRRFFGSITWIDSKEALVKEWRKTHAPPG